MSNIENHKKTLNFNVLTFFDILKRINENCTFIVVSQLY